MLQVCFNIHRIKNIKKEISDIKSKLGIHTKDATTENISVSDDADKRESVQTKNTTSWFWSGSKFFGRKLQQLSRSKTMHENDEDDFDSLIGNSLTNADESFEYDSSFTHHSMPQTNAKSYTECPEISPLLFGPLYVQQKDIPKLHPDTKEFEQWYGHTIRNGGASTPEHCIARQKGLYKYKVKFRGPNPF